MKEAAAWGVGYIARHSRVLAQTCVDAGAVPLLLLCLQEPEISLKQIATSAISDIAKLSLELAQNVVDAGVVPYLVKNLNNTDEKLKKLILCALCKTLLVLVFLDIGYPKSHSALAVTSEMF